MSFGIDVFDANGNTVFSSREKIFYTLKGRMISKPYGSGAYQGFGYINIPSNINQSNSILVVKLKAGDSAVGVRSNSAGVLRFAYPGRAYRNVELYVYTREVTEVTSDHGIQVFDRNGGLMFSSNIETLNIIEQSKVFTFSSGVVTTIPVFGETGVIVNNARHFTRRAEGTLWSEYYGLLSMGWDGLVRSVDTFVGSTSNRGVSLGNVSVTTVKLPQTPPPILYW